MGCFFYRLSPYASVGDSPVAVRCKGIHRFHTPDTHGLFFNDMSGGDMYVFDLQGDSRGNRPF